MGRCLRLFPIEHVVRSLKQLKQSLKLLLELFCPCVDGLAKTHEQVTDHLCERRMFWSALIEKVKRSSLNLFNNGFLEAFEPMGLKCFIFASGSVM